MNESDKDLNNVLKVASDICDKADRELWPAIGRIASDEIREQVSEAFRKDRDKMLSMIYATIGKIKAFGGKSSRYVPRKCRMMDGKILWMPWDTEKDCESTLVCHGRYKTRKACQYAIDLYAVQKLY